MTGTEAMHPAAQTMALESVPPQPPQSFLPLSAMSDIIADVIGILRVMVLAATFDKPMLKVTNTPSRRMKNLFRVQWFMERSDCFHLSELASATG